MDREYERLVADPAGATIKDLEDKIEAMQKQIEAIRGKRAAKRNGAKQKPKGAAAARRQSVSKAAGSAATNGNAGGAAYGQPQAKRPRKNKDAPAYGGADDEDSDSSNITYLTSRRSSDSLAPWTVPMPRPSQPRCSSSRAPWISPT